MQICLGLLVLCAGGLAGAAPAAALEGSSRPVQARSLDGGVVDQFIEVGDEPWAATREGIFRRGSGMWQRIAAPFDDANALVDASPDGDYVYVLERGWRPWGLFEPTFTVEPIEPRLFRSRDGGATWRSFALPPGVSEPVDLDVFHGNGRRLWLVDRRLGLFESSDAGARWRPVVIPLEDIDLGGDEWRGVEIDPHDPDHWFVATRIDDYRSDDGGRTWRATRVGDPTFDPHRPGHAWAVEDGAVLRTRDGGATWRQPLPGRHGRSENEGRIVLSRFDPDWIAIATREGALVSRDGGSNFESLLLPGVMAGQRAFVEPTVTTFDRNGRLLVGTAGKGVYRAASDESLQAFNAGLAASAVSALEVVDVESPGGSQGEHLFFAQLLDGLYWEPSRELGGPAQRQRIPTLRAYAVDDLAVDSDGTMHALADGVQLSCPLDAAFCDSHEIPFIGLEAAPRGPPRVYGVTGFEPNGVLRRDEPSQQWELFSTTTESDVVTTAVAVSPNDGELVTAWDRDATGLGFVRRSIDAAETWTTVGEHDLEVTSLSVTPGRPQRLWAAGRGVFLSDDFGASFAPRGFGELRVRHLELDPTDIDRAWLLLAGETGVWETRTAGASWTRIDGTENLRLLDLGLGNDGTLYGAGYGGLFELPFARLPGPALRLRERFDVRVGFRDPGTDTVQPGIPVVAETLQGDTAAFWFFTPDNVELLVKVLDGRDVNDHFWVFAGVVTDVAYCLEIIDSVTDRVFTHCQEQGQQRSVADVEALAASTLDDALLNANETTSNPGDATSLFLAEGSIRVEISVVEPDGTLRHARAVPLTDQAGAFWFFTPDNLEVLIKLVDGRGVNGHYWVYWGSLTTLQLTIEIFDESYSTTEPVWSFTHPAGPSTSGGDIHGWG